MPRPDMTNHGPLTAPMYLTVGRAGQQPAGFTWRLWASRTSFYLKSRAPGVKHLKLSVHSDDPRHPGGGGFKIAMDTEEAYERDLIQNRATGWRAGDWPVWFPGKPIATDAVLVARLRWTWDVCNRLEPAPPPGTLKHGAVGLAVPPPPAPGDAIDLDLIMSHHRPYWPNEQKARRDNACLGPLQNESGDWLTGLVRKHQAGQYPPPAKALGPRPNGRADELRALGSAVDPTGFLWLIEQRMSRARLADLAQQTTGTGQPDVPVDDADVTSPKEPG